MLKHVDPSLGPGLSQVDVHRGSAEPHQPRGRLQVGAISYVSGATPPLDYKPIEPVRTGRFMSPAEPFKAAALPKT